MQTTFTSAFSARRVFWQMTSNQRLFLLTLIFLGSTFLCLGQKSFTTTQLLSKKQDFSGNVLLYNNIQFLKNNHLAMPVIDKMSFRTETDELDAIRQEYLFRMSFNPKELRDLQDKKAKSNIHLYELKDQLLREESLAKNYECIAKWYYADSELDWLAEQKLLLEDKRTVYKKMMSNSLELGIDKLLSAEEDLQKIDQEILKRQNEKILCIKQLFPDEQYPEQVSLQKINWISLQTMQIVIEQASAAPTLTLDQVRQQNDIERAKLDYDMEVAESNQILDFVQLKYAGRDRLALQREFSLGFSLNIPYKSNNRLNINEAQLEVFDEEIRLELLRQETEEELLSDYAEFDHLIKEWQLIQQYIDNNELENTYKNYISNGSVHPLILLRVKESILKSQRELQKIEKEACFLFIDILTTKGLIGKTPAINYLSDDLSLLK